MRTVPKPRLSGESSTCKPWCNLHDAEPDICHGAAVDLDFSAACRSVDTAKYVDVSLSHCDGEGTTVWLSVIGVGATHFEVEHARQLAEAILERCRQAESASAPAPRGSSDGEVSA